MFSSSSKVRLVLFLMFLKRTHALFLTFLFVILFAFTTKMSAQDDILIGETSVPESVEETQITDDTYSFPILSGSLEWQSFQTHDEMVAATQIPIEVLSTISTRGLAKTVLDYPLLSDIWAFDSVQNGFNIVTGNFNGLQELLTRTDVGHELLALYEQTPPSAIDISWNLEEQGTYAFNIAHLEFLLAQKAVIETMSNDQHAALQKLALSYYEQKEQLPNVYGRLSIETTSVLMGRLYYSSDPSVFAPPVLDGPLTTETPETDEATAYPPYTGDALNVAQVNTDAVDPVNAFLQHGAFAPDEVLNHIENLVRQTVTGSITDEIAVAPEDYSSTVYTPYGSSVSVTTMTWELSSSEIAYLNNWVAQNYPNATRETDASRKYNCHSYAWYSTLTSNNRWMSTPNDDIYWTDGSYLLSSSQGSGSKVSYPSSSDHSAIQATSSSTQLRSKWGQLPRMLHAYDYSPYPIGTGLNYYRLASTCPIITAWQGEYWNNTSLSGTRRLCRNDSFVNFNWGTGSPHIGIPNDNFSARWTRTVYFSAGTYRFTLGGDDGVRLWVDGVLIINQWHDQPYTIYTANRYLSTGNHTIRVEYYEHGGEARVYLGWIIQ